MTNKNNIKTVKSAFPQSDSAKAAIADIDALHHKLGLDSKATQHEKRVLLGQSRVPEKLVEEVAAAADQHGALIGVAFDSEAARSALAFAAAFEPVATKAEALAQRVREAILVAKAEAGGATLAAYATIKGVVRRPEGAPLRDSFDKMKKIMKRGRRVARGSAAAAAPTTPAPMPGTGAAPSPSPAAPSPPATGGSGNASTATGARTAA